MSKVLALISKALVIGSIVPLAPLTAAVTGSVIDGTGKPVAGAHVLLIGSDQNQVFARSHTVRLGAITDSAGHFVFSAPLSTGEYLLCGAGPELSSYLRSCEWAGGEVVAISSGSNADAGAISLATGRPLAIHISDPGHLVSLPSAAASLAGGVKLLVGIKDSAGRFHPAEAPQRTGNDIVFSILVPAGLAPSLWIFSDDFAVTDLRGNRVEVGSGTLNSTNPIVIDPSASVIALTVAGLK